MKLFFIIAMSAIFVFNNVDLNAALPEKVYIVKYTYTDCPGGHQVCTETWYEQEINMIGATNVCVYTKQTLCNGSVHESGTKPNCGIIIRIDTTYLNPSAPIGVIITPGFGEVLLQSNQLVNSQIIDHSTGGIVGTTTINGSGSISTGTLEAGKTYSIMSTNNVGEVTSNTFMLNNDKQIWIGK